MADSVTLAEEAKSKGNELFRAKRWDEAMGFYQDALDLLPPLPQIKPRPPQSDSATDIQPESQSATDIHLESHPDPPESPQILKARSVLHANISACWVSMDDHNKAVDYATKALQDDPTYVKALQRRATCNEKINSWTSLTAAQQDYTTLLTLQPSQETEQKINKLKPRIQEAQAKETAEMMDKLKTLGNSFLGNFGLSTDNFKFVQNEQGGYSVNFSKD